MPRTGSIIPPVPLMLLFALLMWLLARLPVGWSLPPSVQWPLVLLLCFAGIGIALAGVATFRRASTTVNPLQPQAASNLVTSGVYRLSRNPMYLGMLLMLSAWAVWLASAVALLALPAYVLLLNRIQIGPEERALRELFGLEYDRYCDQVRRWL